jgi:hypothetical protein
MRLMVLVVAISTLLAGCGSSSRRARRMVAATGDDLAKDYRS